MDNQMTDAQKAQLANRAARMALIPGSNTQTVNMVQNIFSQSFANYVAGQQLAVNINPAPVGIIKRFWVEITASIGSTAAEVHTAQPLGPSTLLSQITYTDTSNQARVNTTGWHLHMLASIRRRAVFGAAYTTDTPTGFGSNNSVIKMPASLTGAAPANNAPNLFMVYEVPLAYADDDLRGAVLANLINATQTLQLTVNPNFFVATGGDATLSGYKSASGVLGKITNLTINVYQEYIDQFQGLALPQIDLGTQYLLNWTNGGNPSAGIDLVIPYANYRSFLSTIAFYDNAGVANTGSDVNYLALRAANTTNIYKVDPMLQAALTRTKLGDDMPAGAYWMDHRQKPILTQQFGNMSLVFNASAVTSVNSLVFIGYEQLALANQLPGAGSLASAQ